MRFVFLFFLTILIRPVTAQLVLPKVLGNNMVLQQQQPVPVWGWARPGKTIGVRFGKQKKTAVADEKGFWKLELAPLKASFKPGQMIISGDSSITLNNILVGEVWLCSGQSNMEYPMKLPSNFKPPAKGSDSTVFDMAQDHPGIRIFRVEKILSKPDVTTTGWQECRDSALAKFSAAGFYFAKKLSADLRVPIGVIQSAWGGSRIEPWTPAEGYKELPAFAAEAARTPFMIDSVSPGRYYQSMIAPLAPFALRGFLWYQGESNCMINDGMRYADKMQALVQSWRRAWMNEKLPFYSVAIAPYYYTKRKDRLPHTPETLAEFWEAQEASLQLPHTGMIVVTDLVDTLTDIHPSYKWEVGRRLALLALAKDYGKKQLTYSGPVYESMKQQRNSIVLSFRNADGLKSADGQPLTWFTIAGADGVFRPASAEVRGKNIVVTAPDVADPLQVRFAWNEKAQPNLVNGAGLPAVPFRTDKKEWKNF